MMSQLSTWGYKNDVTTQYLGIQEWYQRLSTWGDKNDITTQYLGRQE